MKLPYLIHTFILAILIFISCEGEETESLKKAKLEFRQEIDQTILEIDEEMENMQEKIEFMEDYASDVVKDRQQYLKNVRQKLRERSDSLALITEKDWMKYKSKVKQKIEQVEDSLITWTDGQTEIPEPPVYP
jgi:hypothetical protein